jgi:type II secretory pathway predicted ATPase ExeA
MDYLNFIQCKNEPFAATSGKDLYLSQPIREAFEKLTHSIRLGAGIHTVVGTNGTGKSTLISQLSEKFSVDKNTIVLTVNNPQYSNLQQFLTTLAGAFKTLKVSADIDDKKLQEGFNSFFHKECLKQKKNLLLLINNGHALPDFCLQALDNLYDHHTDCRRMLQAVICGEPSLQKKIKSIKELNSRIVFTITLKSFSFSETKELIRYHLDNAAEDPNSPPSLFSSSSQWAIYRLTQGNQKQIIDLCHLIVLTLVIENKKKADWFITLRCANLLIPKRAKKLQLIRAGSLSSLIVFMLIFGLGSEQLKTVMAPPAKLPVKIPVAKKVVPPKPQPKEVAKVEKAVQSEPEVKKEITIVPTPAEKEIAAIIEKTAQPEREVAEEIAAVTPPADEIAAIIEKAAQPEAEVAEKSAAVTPSADDIAAIIKKATEEKSPIPEVPVQEEPSVETKPVAPEPEPDEKIAKIVSPAMKEKREVMPGDTFLVMIQKVYGPGHLKPHFINQVIAANPQLRDHDNLAIGDEVFFPVLTARDEMPVAIAMEEKAVAAVKKTGSLVSKKLDRELQPADSPDLIGKLTVQPGDTLGKLIRGVYGPFSFKPDYTSKVLAVNKQLKNPDRLEVGETIYFPDLPIIPEIGLPAKPQSVSSRGDMPEFLGEIIAIEEETFGDMIRKIYGPYSFNDENVAKVLAVNPGLKSPELLSVGQKILFPTILVALTPEAPDVWWVKIISLDNLQSAYRFLRVYSKWSPPMLIIPSRDNAGRVLFNVVLQKHFMDEQSAQKTISELPNSITIDAKVLHGLDSNTFYYWTKQKD